MLLHLADAGQQGLKRVMIRTVDTDVVVIAIALRDRLLVNEVWLAFKVGKNFRYIPVHDIVAKLNTMQWALVLLCVYGMRHRLFFLWSCQER